MQSYKTPDKFDFWKYLLILFYKYLTPNYLE